MARELWFRLKEGNILKEEGKILMISTAIVAGRTHVFRSELHN